VTAGRLGPWAGGELADEAGGGGRRKDGVAGGNGVDGGDQASGLGVFEQETTGAGPQPGVDVIVKVEGGQDQHFARQPGRHDVAGGLDAVVTGHPDVHEHHVGTQRGAHGDGGRPIGGLADHLEIVFGVEYQAEAHPDERMVVDQEHADHGGTAAPGSSRAVTRQPRG
jgi:hypothetical protein